MKAFRGVPASPGIAVGKAFLYSDDDLLVPEYTVEIIQVDAEMERYRAAVARAVADLEQIKTRAVGGHDFVDAHLLMLQDPEIESKVDVRIRRMPKNVEWVLKGVVDELIAKLATVKDSYLVERTLDIRDVSRRVLRHLLRGAGQPGLSDLKDEVIVVTPSLMPSDAVGMNKKLVRGIVMDHGGATNHTAILARSFEIPAVLGTERATLEIQHGDWLIVDGSDGLVIVRPEPEVIEEYRERQARYRGEMELMRSANSQPVSTTDGHNVRLMANIDIPDEVEAVLMHGADGVGLYRSEFLFLEHGVDVSEDVQYDAYRHVLQGMDGRVVTIRTLDLGGDKLTDEFPTREDNPLLGWRAIRFCLANPAIFRTQLRALLRASVHGRLQIMFPMISGVEELRSALDHLQAVRLELESESVPTAEVRVGTMIEVPSAALVSEHLARLVDFFSIGTNDLTQYTLAIDRGNGRVAGLNEPFHPAVLRLIRLVIENAHRAEIPVSMCGELASDPRAAAVLLGLGLDEFSMNAVSVPRVKQILRGLSMSQAKIVADHVLGLENSTAIEKALDVYLAQTQESLHV